MSSGSSTPAGDPLVSEDEAPILALERFAALSADIESGAARDEVIAREGLSVEAWTRAQESWLGRMADEAARKRFDLTNRYNSAFVAQRRAEGGFRRAANKKKAPPRPGIHAPADAPPASVAAPPSFVAAPAFAPQMPSFMVAPAPAAPPPPVVAEPAAFVAAPSYVAPPPSFAMPAVVAPPSPVMIHGAPAVAAPPPTNLAGTVAAEMISPFASGAPLPFKQGRAVLADAAPAAPRSVRSGATLAGVDSPFAQQATPFKKSEELRTTGPTTPLALIKPIARPAFDPNAVMDLSGTVVADLREPAEPGGKLPFRATPDSPPRPPPPGPPPPPGRGLPFRSPSSTTTPAVAAPAVAAAAPAPAASPAAPRATRFTLEQFASLSAEIAVTPSAVAQVRGRYGLDEASHRAEAEEWGRRFSADKDLFTRYGALFQSYRDWLARAPR
jgi:hypothetical protein